MSQFPDNLASIGTLEAQDRLAQRLHRTMERFDPSEDDTWERLTEVQREFFRACVRELMLERGLVLVALS